MYGDDYFEGGGAGYAGYLDEGDLLTEHGRRYARLLARHAAPGAVLDVGAAAGFVLAGLAAGGWRAAGIEPNAAMAAHARERLGLDVRQGTIESFTSDRRFDLVTLIQVVAHLADPRAALAAAARLTRPGGHWLIETWDRDSLTARLLGRRWHEYSPPSVLHWFSRDSLARLASEVGMREVARGRPAKRIGARHAVALLGYKLAGPRGARAAARLAGAIPKGLGIPYPMDDIFWMLLRKPDGDGPAGRER